MTTVRFRVRRDVLALTIVSLVSLLVTPGCKRPGAAVTAVAPAVDEGPVNPKVPRGAKSSGGKHAVIETAKGAIEIELFPDAAPKAVENFRLPAEHVTTTD